MEVEWKAFELRPEGQPIVPKPPGYLERAWESVRALAAEVGLEMRPNSRRDRYSRLALEGAKFAERHGKLEEYNEAVFRLYFVEDGDIGDPAALRAVAESVGLDGEAFARALAERTFKPDVDRDCAEARELGITGIPCFISGNAGLMGVRSYETLKRLAAGQLRL